MSFWDRLRQLVTGNRSQASNRHRRATTVTPHLRRRPPVERQMPTVQNASHAIATEQSEVSKSEASLSTTHQTATPAERPSAVMLVLYLDDQNKPLADPQWLNGQVGDQIHFKPKHINGYLLFHIIGFTTHFTSKYRIMTLQFTQQLGHPVILYAVNYDTGEILASPQIQTGALNTPFAFTQPDINGFHTVKASRSLSGHFTEQSQTIVVMLRRNDWTAVQRIDFYVRLLADTTIVDMPDGRSLNFEFPKDSVWRVFIRVNTTHGETWFNLGGPQWINGKQVAETHRPQPRPLPQRRPISYEPVDYSGAISFVPGRALHTYQEPNGPAVKLIADGTSVKVTGTYTDENDVKWYQLDGELAIRAQYVKLVKSHSIG